jgi:la-related protein 1
MWFSDDYLSTDTRLRKHMDSLGFVPLSIIASHDEQSLDIDVLRAVCEGHKSFLYAKDEHGTELMRLEEGWKQWVLPVAERERKTTYRTYQRRVQPGFKSFE